MRIKWWVRRIRAYIGRPRTQVQIRAVSLDSENRCQNPILLIGVHRSGTSLTRRILNSHPNIACPPETFFLSHYVEMLRDPDTFAGLRGFGLEGRAEAISSLAEVAATFHERFRLAQEKGRWADKTPQYTAILEELRELFGVHAQFILLYRHPYDIVSSIDGLNWEMGAPGIDRFEGNVIYVKERIGKMLEFESKFPHQCYRLHYRDLVANPEAELRSLCEYLNEEFHLEMLDFNSGSHNLGTEDLQVLSTSTFSASHDNWMQLPKKKIALLKLHLGDLAQNLGYLQ